MPQRDSLSYTVMVATILCVVCSLAVSAAAVALRPIQEANERLDQQKNILDAAGLPISEFGKPAKDLTKDEIADLYTWVSEEMVDLATGEYTDEVDKKDFDLMDAARNPKTSVEIIDPAYDPGEDRRQKISKVYFVRKPNSDGIRQVVLPIHGKGLWGTLYGYLALKSDLETVQGITFYKHKETPGLGGEVDNPGWKKQWEGLKLYDDSGKPAAFVFKGPAPDDNPYAVDGLSGATITSRGVTNLVRYWASEDGYGPFLSKLEQQIAGESSTTMKTEKAATESAPSVTEQVTPKVGE